MNATLTLDRDRLFGDLLPGDTITAIDGRVLDRPHRVREPHLVLPGQVEAVGLVNPLGSATAWNLYPDTQVVSEVTVVRGAPRDDTARRVAEAAEASATPEPARRGKATARPRRQRTRRFGSLTLIFRGAATWETPDGRFVVARDDDNVTSCDRPHPVRITEQMAEAARAESWRPEAQFILRTLAAGRRGYVCPGEETHYYSTWGVWDTWIDDWMARENEHYATFATAAWTLAEHLGLAGDGEG